MTPPDRPLPRRPRQRTKVRQAVYGEVLRRIREEEPAKPSTRLGESKDAPPPISARRKMEPARLARYLRGDLDWIVMKAIEKDRNRRYETANGFARDVRRHLDDDAVDATPPSRSYRLRKLARKHRVALATAGTLAADPSLADDRRARHPYNAACAAALAGSGFGADDPAPFQPRSPRTGAFSSRCV